MFPDSHIIDSCVYILKDSYTYAKLREHDGADVALVLGQAGDRRQSYGDKDLFMFIFLDIMRGGLNYHFHNDYGERRDMINQWIKFSHHNWRVVAIYEKLL